MFDATKPPVQFSANNPPAIVSSTVIDAIEKGTEAFEITIGRMGKRYLSYADFHAYQTRMRNHIVANKYANVWVFLGGGKEQPLTSKILTPHGWTTMGDVSVGDTICHPKEGTSRVTKTYPQGLKQVYKITFTCGATVECGENHLWEVTHWKSRIPSLKRITKVMSTKELLTKKYSKRYRISSLANVKGAPLIPFVFDTIVRTNKVVEQKCISVDATDGLYITDNYVVTHNTIGTLTAFDDMQKLGWVKKMLVVAPKKVCELTWDDECTKWEHLRERNFTFSKMLGGEKKKQQALFSDADIYLVNYESINWLVNQLDRYFIKQNLPLPFDFLVWDEVSKMKRKDSNRFKLFKPILPYFERILGLTASPASNGLQNVWAQSFVTDMGARLGVDYEQFLSKYFRNEGGLHGKWIPYDEGETRDMIATALSDNTLEIPQEGNLVLPPIHEQIITVTLPKKKMEEYLKLEQQFFTELDNGTEIDVFNEASLANKLLQFSNGIVYHTPDPTNPKYREEIPIHDEKYKAFKEIYESTGDEPIFLVYNFTSELEKLKKMYPDARVLVGCDEEESIEIRDLFNAGKLKLVITHPASSGYGINLQGSCSTVVWFGIPYNQEHFEQTIGRIWRQGQLRPVRLMLILAKDTRDFMVHQMLHDKTNTQNKLKKALRELRLKLGL